MFVLGLMGSPRRNGNTHRLLGAFLEGAEARGAQVSLFLVGDADIMPCQGCRLCEQQGRCRYEDDDMGEIYGLLRRADIVCMATPVFFYSPPAQLKALIDRCQALWARRYRLHLEEPKAKIRRGFTLAVGATQGKRLFEGTSLTARYFFDAVSARDEGILGYKGIESPGDIARHPTALSEARDKGWELVGSLADRSSVVCVCRQNARRSQMAEAFFQAYAAERFDVESCGNEPAETVDPDVVAAMAEKGIDIGYRRPKSCADIGLTGREISEMITMGCDVTCPAVSAGNRLDWDLADPAGLAPGELRRIRDQIEQHVAGHVSGEAGRTAGV